mmetsp:Transcript_98186/g.316700  ORF Transcript_98186/g.316700 Transcript_98186/m.316700 type:complete len:116 (+) Transcript_98186:441-788(+)
MPRSLPSTSPESMPTPASEVPPAQTAALLPAQSTLQTMNIRTCSDVERWLAPANSKGRIGLDVGFRMLCERFPEEDPGEIEDALIEWMRDPSKGTLPKHVKAASAYCKIPHFFGL